MTGQGLIEFRLSDDERRQLAAEIAALLGEGETARRGWMRIERAADYLDWPVERLYKLAARDEIPYRKQRGRLLFQPDELDRWLEAFRQGPTV